MSAQMKPPTDSKDGNEETAAEYQADVFISTSARRGDASFVARLRSFLSTMGVKTWSRMLDGNSEGRFSVEARNVMLDGARAVLFVISPGSQTNHFDDEVKIALSLQKPVFTIAFGEEAMASVPEMLRQNVILVSDVITQLQEIWARVRSFVQSVLDSTPGKVGMGLPLSAPIHIISDDWTVEDALGYNLYAHALFRAMVHPMTTLPFTISVQAPWGGGKTSLMHMLRAKIDPMGDKLQHPSSVDRSPEVMSLHTVLEWFRNLPRGVTTGEVPDKKTAANFFKRLSKWLSAGDRGRKHEPVGVQPLPAIPEDAARTYLSIWFNAWKYQSSSQVYAGLVDAIMHQIATRLPAADRAWFWIRLNAARIDWDKLRMRIHQDAFSRAWKLVLTCVLGLLGLGAAAVSKFQLDGWAATSTITLPLAALLAATPKIYALIKNSREKLRDASLELGDYISMPVYENELGVIHAVEQDLRRVLESLPGNSDQPMVIFIDDLDRCSPTHVAQVIEGINLFLASGLKQFIFVFGMDTELVAAALQAAHRDMIEFLPYDTGAPIGWRFMDKFVQLPFIVPPVTPDDLSRYVNTFGASASNRPGQTLVDSIAAETRDALVSGGTAFNDALEKKMAELELPPVDEDELKLRISEKFALEAIEEASNTFDTNDPMMTDILKHAAKYFKHNPREIKRFVNVFRFHYTLWAARERQGKPVPALESLTLWTVLQLKWPDFVRWLYRSGGNEWRRDPLITKSETGSFTRTRLEILEELSESAMDPFSWKESVSKRFDIDDRKHPWLRDDDLLEFLHAESSGTDKESRLSSGFGKGLW